MYDAFYHIHSYWAYVVVLLVLIATFNALIGLIRKREFFPADRKLSLVAMVVTHIQLLIGIILFFVSPKIVWFSENVGVSQIMSNDTLRLYNVEHPLMMILAFVFITIGFSRHKKKKTSNGKLKQLSLFYALTSLFILAMIPWSAWI